MHYDPENPRRLNNWAIPKPVTRNRRGAMKRRDRWWDVHDVAPDDNVGKE